MAAIAPLATALHSQTLSQTRYDTMPTTAQADHHVRTDATEEFYNNEDGIYEGIHEADYHDLQRASSTVLNELLDRSPAHAKAKMEDAHDPTSAQKLGTAIHKAVLEPELFQSEYDVKGQCEETTASGSRCSYDGKHPVLDEDTGELSWYCGTHYKDHYLDADIEVLSESKMETVESVRARAQEHEAASALLYDHPGLSELTVLWTHSETEVKCKSRIDKLIHHPELGYVAIDLKTTRNAKPSERGFPRSAAQYSYYRQAAFYREALRESGVPVDSYFILAVEKEPPYSVVPYLVRDDRNQQPIAEGAMDMIDALTQWKQCQVQGSWPSYTEEVERLILPEWAFD